MTVIPANILKSHENAWGRTTSINSFHTVSLIQSLLDSFGKSQLYSTFIAFSQLETTENRIKTAGAIFIKIYIQKHKG